MYSVEVASMPPVPEYHFFTCVQQVVVANSAYVPPHDSDAILYIRPVLFASGPQVTFTALEFSFCVYVQPISIFCRAGALDAITVEGFARAAPCGVGSAKLGGNYAPVIQWSNMARQEGYSATLYLDSTTHSMIEDFGTSAFLGVMEDKGPVHSRRSHQPKHHQ